MEGKTVNIIDKINLLIKDKHELFKEKTIEEFVSICFWDNLLVSNQNEHSGKTETILNNFTGCERFSTKDTKKMFDYFLDSFLLRYREKLPTDKKEKLKEVKKLWNMMSEEYRLLSLFQKDTTIIQKFPSLLINLYELKLFKLDEVKSFIINNEYCLNKLDWNDDSIDIVRFTKENGLNKEIKQAYADEHVNFGSVFNPSVFVDIVPRFFHCRIIISTINELIDKGYKVDWNFDNIDFKEQVFVFDIDSYQNHKILFNKELTNIYEFKLFLEKLYLSGQTYTFDVRKIQERAKEIVYTMNTNEKLKYSEVVNWAYSSKQQQRKEKPKL
jgi:hypothetical protein